MAWTRGTKAAVLACAMVMACGNRTRAPVGDDAGVAIPPGASPVASGATTPAPSAALATSGSPIVRGEPVSLAPIVHAADPSVVTINTVSEEVEVSPFTGRRRPFQMRGLGTGFIIDKTGVILTNNHVVEGASTVQVKLSDDREFPGRVVGTDPRTDIAVVRIDAKDVRPLLLGDSDAMDVGDWVVAIGNPFGLSHTVSAGIISAKGRTGTDVELDPAGYYDFIQTDASINPGNSGGPLLNLKGQVVAMNAAIRGGGAQGIGFAIPINMIKQLLPMLLRDGHVTRSALGVRVVDVRQLTGEDRQALKLPENEKISGAVIAHVITGGPAERGGLERGDVIVAFDGQPIERSTQLQWLASTAGVGRSATVRVRRAGKVFDLNLILGPLTD
ncbi:MAG TPA: trypsin-like peptidase domain-containing protein, partial [Polyangiaceae bacterium]|nr:trypsin-like peptidase domain-containing protein [Polyangiaceae bacterium]